MCPIICLCWGLTSQSTIFQSCRDIATASWVINQYFRGVKCLAQGHNTAAVGFEPRTSRSGVRHSTTELPCVPYKKRESPVHINDAPNFRMHTWFFLSLNGTSCHKTSHIYLLVSVLIWLKYCWIGHTMLSVHVIILIMQCGIFLNGTSLHKSQSYLSSPCPWQKYC